MEIESLLDKKKNILVYRRTHTGDPSCSTGEFGIHDCMGSLRDWDYDAAIGIGGNKPDPGSEGIAGKITWIGVGIVQRRVPTEKEKSLFEFRSSIVSFGHWVVLDEEGPPLKEISPKLHEYMFVDRHIPRAAKNFSDEIYKELMLIISKVFSDYRGTCHRLSTEAHEVPPRNGASKNSLHQIDSPSTNMKSMRRGNCA